MPFTLHTGQAPQSTHMRAPEKQLILADRLAHGRVVAATVRRAKPRPMALVLYMFEAYGLGSALAC